MEVYSACQAMNSTSFTGALITTNGKLDFAFSLITGLHSVPLVEGLEVCTYGCQTVDQSGDFASRLARARYS